MEGAFPLGGDNLYKEIGRLLALSKEGDTKAKIELLSRLNPLIISSIRHYYYNPHLYEDLLQEGYEIVLRSIEEYDSTKGSYFLGFVKLKLKYHYLNKHKEKHAISLNQIIGNDEMELIELIKDDEPSPLDKAIQNEELTKLKQAINLLTPRQREVVIAYYIEDMSIGEIGEKLGIAYRTVVNTKARAIDVLKKTIVK